MITMNTTLSWSAINTICVPAIMATKQIMTFQMFNPFKSNIVSLIDNFTKVAYMCWNITLLGGGGGGGGQIALITGRNMTLKALCLRLVCSFIIHSFLPRQYRVSGVMHFGWSWRTELLSGPKSVVSPSQTDRPMSKIMLVHARF